MIKNHIQKGVLDVINNNKMFEFKYGSPLDILECLNSLGRFGVSNLQCQGWHLKKKFILYPEVVIMVI